MAKLLVIAGLVLVANLMISSDAFGYGLIKKQIHKNNQPSAMHDDPPDFGM